MKKLIITTLFATSTLGCKTDADSSPNASNVIEVEQPQEIKHIPKFSTLKEMLEDSGDFNEEVGTLKFISSDKNKLHIQISKPILEKDLESVKTEIAKRDVIYVAFQTFAQTDINELTITSIPNSYENPKRYFQAYKQTVKVDREKAKHLLKKYLNSEDFSILYEEYNGLWVPSKNFSVLKFEKLNEVFDDLK